MKMSICALPFALAISAAPALAQVVPSEPQISATGRGEVRIKPTRAVVFFTVRGRGATAVAAAAENAKLVAATIRALTAAGVKSDEISNPGYNVSPEYDYTRDGPKQKGFLATNSIRVDVPKVADVGRIIDVGLAGGANQVGAAQFLGDEMEKTRRDALKLAVQAAKEDAEAMAVAAGGRLGRLLSVTGGGSSPNPGAMMRETVMATAGGTAAPPPTSLNPADLTVTAVATARWEFLPGNR